MCQCVQSICSMLSRPAWLPKASCRDLFCPRDLVSALPCTTGFQHAPGTLFDQAHTCWLRQIPTSSSRVGEASLRPHFRVVEGETCGPSDWAQKVCTLAHSIWRFRRSEDIHVEPRSPDGKTKPFLPNVLLSSSPTPCPHSP